MKKEFLAAGFWLLFSAYASLEALRLGLGSGNKPGPGFFPFGAASAIGIIALSRLLQTRGKTPSTNMAGGSAIKETNKDSAPQPGTADGLRNVADLRRINNARFGAGAFVHQELAGNLLGPFGEHVSRQPDAGDS